MLPRGQLGEENGQLNLETGFCYFKAVFSKVLIFYAFWLSCKYEYMLLLNLSTCVPLTIHYFYNLWKIYKCEMYKYFWKATSLKNAYTYVSQTSVKI